MVRSGGQERWSGALVRSAGQERWSGALVRHGNQERQPGTVTRNAKNNSGCVPKLEEEKSGRKKGRVRHIVTYLNDCDCCWFY